MNIIVGPLEHFEALNLPIPLDSGINCPYRETDLCSTPAFQSPHSITQVTLFCLLMWKNSFVQQFPFWLSPF